LAAQNDDSFDLAGFLRPLLLLYGLALAHERIRLRGETTYHRPVKFNK
jgi:hypothetical protein